MDMFAIQPLEEVLQQHSEDVVVLSVKDEAAYRLSELFVNQMKERGAQKIDSLTFWGSYAAVISQGQVINEAANSSGEAVLTRDNAIAAAEVLEGKPFRIYSAGNPYGNRSSIEVDGKEYSPNKKGLNIAVFDQTGRFIRSYTFDTHSSNLSLIRLQ